ncbi:MAG: nitroreductase family protein [Bacteroidota bacterium]|nr:nitroreductase family protein [Bacteroidota bacterium]
MKLLELINQRQSVRRYSSQAVEKEKIEQCLEAAYLSPSACNAQPWKFIVIDDPELKNKIARQTYDPIISFNRFVPQAPVIIAIVVEKSPIVPRVGGRIKDKPYYLIDIGIAAEHLCLQATELGLGTCMLGWFNEKAVKKLLNVPKERSMPLLISLGYPIDDYPLRKKIRKAYESVRKYNSY